MSREHIHFVTGRLAEHALHSTLAELAEQVDFDYSIQVMPITVAALMTPQWIARRITPPDKASRIILPGYCDGDLQPLRSLTNRPVELGPRDLRRLGEFFGRESSRDSQYGAYDIQILAEINHAPRLSLEEILRQAKLLADDGADLIDVGCEPGGPWSGVAECVKALRDQGHRVSIDSLNPVEIEPAVHAGAELVLSVNATNRHAAADWGCEVVVIPDEIETLGGLDETVETLAAAGVPLRIDPILEPLGFGFAASLERYQQVRHRYPDAEMMMGIGNLTEMTDVDSAGVNVLLLGICQELGIRSILTTQVINWARSSVKECDLARRLVYYSHRHKVPPKHIEPDLILLRDASLHEHGDKQLSLLAQQIKDNNYRIFAEKNQLRIISGGIDLSDKDPFMLFQRLSDAATKPVDSTHAFYLGYEMAKAATALTLGKEYNQDESLNWGFLTQLEQSHRLKKSPSKRPLNKDDHPATEGEGSV